MPRTSRTIAPASLSDFRAENGLNLQPLMWPEAIMGPTIYRIEATPYTINPQMPCETNLVSVGTYAPVGEYADPELTLSIREQSNQGTLFGYMVDQSESGASFVSLFRNAAGAALSLVVETN